MDVQILVCAKFSGTPFAICPGGMGMAVDFVHLETDLIPVDGRGRRGNRGGVDAVRAVCAHGGRFCRLSKLACEAKFCF